MDFRLTADQEALGVGHRQAGRATSSPSPRNFTALRCSAHELERNSRTVSISISLSTRAWPARARPWPSSDWRACRTRRKLRSPCWCGRSLPGEWPRPLALVENGRPGRFVAEARTLLVIDGESIGLAQPAAGEIEPVESLFAYPMGRWKGSAQSTPLAPTDAANVRKWLRVAIAAGAERTAACGGRIGRRTSHHRKQFGRPLGTFQALRHRMAECAVLAGGVRWLALKAAGTADEGMPRSRQCTRRRARRASSTTFIRCSRPWV